MDEESTDTNRVETRWFIDLNWYQRNNRSILALIQGYLCARCAGRLKSKGVSAADLLATIGDCCSRTPGFITRRLPVRESIFRLFLAGGNQPLTLEELGRQLSEWRDGDIYTTSPEILSRLLENDQYYGFGQVKG